MHHECVHVQELTDAAGTEEAEADAEYDNAVKEAIVGVQEAVISINEHLEEVRYEIAALESDWTSEGPGDIAKAFFFLLVYNSSSYQLIKYMYIFSNFFL